MGGILIWSARPEHQVARPNKNLDEARANGHPTYFTGKPCKYGHIAPRATGTSTCLECAKRHHATYREKTPGRVAEWVDKNREAHRLVANAWKHANKEKVRNSGMSYYRRNLAAVKKKNTAWRESNADKLDAARKNWIASNPERVAAQHAYRRASLKRAVVAWANNEEMVKMYALAISLTNETGVAHEVDHIVPIIHRLVCGLHCEANMQVLPASENRRKSNKFFID